MKNISFVQKFFNAIFKNPNLIIGSGVLLFTQQTEAHTQPEQPNILIIMTDQQAFNALGYSGNSVIKTPNLDKLAGNGVYFSQAVTPCPVSVPARTSILTGRLTETTTIRDNKDVESRDALYYQTFDEILSRAGYHSEYYGKFHSPEYMARVYKNPPVEGMSGTDPIIKWEPQYVKYVTGNIKKRELKPGELYETTFYGGTVPYRLELFTGVDKRILIRE